MGDKSGFMSEADLSLIVFDDLEEAKFGAALQALADQMLPCSKGTNQAVGSFYGKQQTEFTNSEVSKFKQKNETFPTSVNIETPFDHTYNIKKHYIKKPTTNICITKDATVSEKNKSKNSKSIDDKLSSYLRSCKTAQTEAPDKKKSKEEDVGENDDSIEFVKQYMPDEEGNEKAVNYRNFILYICPECGLECGSQLEWKYHTSSVHKSDTIAWLNLSLIENVEGKSIYQCFDCGKKFNTDTLLTSLKVHRIKHLPYKNYMKCRLCSSSYSAVSSLYGHLKKNHIEFVIPKKKPTVEYIKICCPICQELQFNLSFFWEHLHKKHNYLNKIENSTIRISRRTYSCKFCHQNISQADVMHHILKHEAIMSFQCILCQKYEADPNRAMLHVRNHFHFDQQKLIECGYCKAKFAGKALLLEHFHLSHKNELPIRTVCNSEYENAPELISHMEFNGHTIDLTTDSNSNKSILQKNENRVAEKTVISNSSALATSTNTLTKVKQQKQANRVDYKNNSSDTNNVTEEGDEKNLEMNDGSENVGDLSKCLDFIKEEPQLQEFQVLATGDKLSTRDSSSNDNRESVQDDKNHKQDKFISDYKDFINYFCPECNRECGSYFQWRTHIESQHKSSLTTWKNSTTKLGMTLYYKCLACYQKFDMTNESQYLYNHRIRHLPYKDYMKCRICFKGYQTRHGIEDHITIFHSGVASCKELLIK